MMRMMMNVMRPNDVSADDDFDEDGNCGGNADDLVDDVVIP